MTTFARLLTTRSLLLPASRPRQPLFLGFYSLGNFSRSHTMLDSPDSNLNSGKRRADEPSQDMSPTDPKRSRLVDEVQTHSASVNSTRSSGDNIPSYAAGSSTYATESTKGDGTALLVDGMSNEAERGGEMEKKTATGSKLQQGKKKQKSRREPRGRDGWRSRNEEDAEKEVVPELDDDGNAIPKALRYPKRQCALLMGFCGSGYSGMQIQPDRSKTIEGVLFDALVKIGAVSQDNADNPTKVGLARAARTDAGVHAAGNVVSLKMIITIPGVKDIVARINEELPSEIRLWSYCRTQNSFNARLICESRKYTYFFPTYMLIPPKPGSAFHRIWSENGGDPGTNPFSSFWENQESSTKDEDLSRKRAWRINPEQVATLRQFAARYEGTHNFHNFTVGRDFGDRSNNRYMKRLEVADPIVYGETEWISVLFHGQSFMLHQRKMMAILVLGARMGTSLRVLSELYGQRGVFVPKMPALGLLLEEPLFESYNQRMGVINEKLEPTDDQYRPPIDFDVHRDDMQAFKETFIYKTMREVEDRDGLFDAWIRAVDAYAGNDLLYLSPSGAVPEAAVIKPGVKRANPFREKKVFDTTSFKGDSEIKKKLEDDDEGDADEEMLIDKRLLAETEG